MPNAYRSNVYFAGLKNLDKLDQKRIKEIIMNHAEKLGRDFKKINTLKFHFKSYDHDGGARKYSVHLLIDGPTHPISIDTNTSNWNSVTVINRIFSKARRHLEKKFNRPKEIAKRRTKL